MKRFYKGLFVVILLFAVSCFLPAFRFNEGSEAVYGCQALLLFPFVFYYPAWYANILFLFSIGTALFRQLRLASVYAAMAALLGGIHLLPNLYEIVTLYAGYYCWLGSMALLYLICRVAQRTG